MKKRSQARGRTNNLIIVSDLHVGCQNALCHPNGATMEEGGRYIPSILQGKIWAHWEDFWTQWVPTVTRGEEFDLVVNGDLIDGVHHNSTHQWSHNLTDQGRHAEELLRPVFGLAKRKFIIKGSEAHDGRSGKEAERIAESLGAEPTPEGQFARYDLNIRVGKALVNILHTIGTTGSQAYESTAVHKEIIEALTEAARHGAEPPDVIVRSHRHRYFRTSFSGDLGDCISIVTPGWQGKTPFTRRISGGRLSLPQFGGVLVRAGDEDEIYTRHKTWHIPYSKVV